MENRELIRLHQLAAQGMDQVAIAKILGVHRNTVRWHLSGRATYPESVVRKLGLVATLPETNRMRVYDAAVYLPGWPGRDKIHRLIKAGVLRTRVGPDGKTRCHWITRRHLAAAAKRMLPPGLYFRTDTLDWYTDAAPRIIEACRDDQVHSRYWPVKQWAYLHAPRVMRIAQECGNPIHLPAATIHRVNRCLELTGIATV